MYHKNVLVVDLQGGFADASALIPWTSETRTVIFSATKAVGALCVAMCVDRGYVKYEDLVVSFWPEFGQHGKDKITVDLIMTNKVRSPPPLFKSESGKIYLISFFLRDPDFLEFFGDVHVFLI